MPSKIKITEHTQRYCHPCEHLKHENVIYGHDFVRGTYVCHHPDANEFGPLSDNATIAAKEAELRAKISECGRTISKHHDHQPSWCPLSKPKQG